MQALKFYPTYKLASWSSMDAGKSHETLGSETKVLFIIYGQRSSQSLVLVCRVSLWLPKRHNDDTTDPSRLLVHAEHCVTGEDTQLGNSLFLYAQKQAWSLSGRRHYLIPQGCLL